MRVIRINDMNNQIVDIVLEKIVYIRYNEDEDGEPYSLIKLTTHQVETRMGREELKEAIRHPEII